uniref:Uncharacterized protein n=1 Tax=Brassica campestris TaxID=3711 RepID=M4DW72_BRACM
MKTGDDGSKVASISRVKPTEHTNRSISARNLKPTASLLQSRATYGRKPQLQSSDKAVDDGTVKTKQGGPETMKNKVLRRRHGRSRADRTPESI